MARIDPEKKNQYSLTEQNQQPRDVLNLSVEELFFLHQTDVEGFERWDVTVSGKPADGLAQPFDRAMGKEPIDTKNDVHTPDDDIKNLLLTPGYLIFKEGKLSVVDDISEFLEYEEGTEQFILTLKHDLPKEVYSDLLGRFLDQQIEAHSMNAAPASVLEQRMQDHVLHHGLASGLRHLDEISRHKGPVPGEVSRQQFVPNPWPEEIHEGDSYLHVIPHDGPGASNVPKGRALPIGGDGQPSVILKMMEPDLSPEGHITIQGRQISNAELVLWSFDELSEAVKDEDNSEEILQHKIKLDAFYKNVVKFNYEVPDGHGGSRTMIVTKPTKSYFPNQYIVISQTDRRSLSEVVVDRSTKEQKLERDPTKTQEAPARLMTPERTHGEIQEILEEVDESINPEKVKENRPAVASMVGLLRELEADSVIGQNSFDASTDTYFQHLQVATDVPTHLVPLFNAPEQVKFETSYVSGDNEKFVKVSAIRRESFPGTTYKVTLSDIDDQSIAFLQTLQDRFLDSENEGSSINLISRKTEEGYEVYFVLRKSISTYPQLQERMIEAGDTRPGWAEVAGIRITKGGDYFDRLPDEEYTPLMDMFGVERKECETFEAVARDELSKIGPVRHNLLETHLAALRSDAETSNMWHCALIRESSSTDDSRHFALNAPDDMQPNIFIMPNMFGSYQELIDDTIERATARVDNEQNYGLIAVDENVLASLPEMNLFLEESLPLLRQEYLEIDSTEQSFKSFLLERLGDDPVREMILAMDDFDVDHFLDDPVDLTKINFHRAIMRHVHARMKQKDDGSEGVSMNYRTMEYAYGSTNLISPETTPRFLDVNEAQEHCLLLGGTKFNTHPSVSVTLQMKQMHAVDRFIDRALPILTRGPGNVDEWKSALPDLAADLVDSLDMKSVRDAEQILEIIAGKYRAISAQYDLDVPLTRSMKEELKNEMIQQIAEKMLPSYAIGEDSYSTQDSPSQLHDVFVHGNKIRPCGFRKYISPTGVTCIEPAPFPMGLMPTGKKIAVVMNGGQAPGVADVAVGAILAAGPHNDVYVFTHGNRGLIRGDAVLAKKEDIRTIQSQGGFPGGTTRVPLLSDEDIATMKENVQQFDGVIFIGGDGSYGRNSQHFLDAGVPVYFCIKTIDGDFQVEDADFTLGFYTAVEGYGEMIQDFRSRAAKSNEVHFLQVGGRYAGFLALGTSALLPPHARPNICIYPEEVQEKGWSFNHVVDVLAKSTAYRMALGKPYGVNVVAEGVIQELPEVKKLIDAIQDFIKENDIDDLSGLKEQLKQYLPKEAEEGELSLYEVLCAFSDADVEKLAKPDPLGRVPFAQIDTYAALGRLVESRLESYQSNPESVIEITDSQQNIDDEMVLGEAKLPLTVQQYNKFVSTLIPSMKGTKSNYDQRSRHAKGLDYDHGIGQGMAAVSAALQETVVDGKSAAIIATGRFSQNQVGISTEVKAAGEKVEPDHVFVAQRNATLIDDIFL